MSYMCAVVYVTIYFKASFLMRIKTSGKLKVQFRCDWHLTALDSKVLNNVLYITIDVLFCMSPSKKSGLSKMNCRLCSREVQPLMGRMFTALQNPLFIVAHTTLLTNQFPYTQISELELFEGTTCLSNHQPRDLLVCQILSWQSFAKALK